MKRTISILVTFEMKPSMTQQSCVNYVRDAFISYSGGYLPEDSEAIFQEVAAPKVRVHRLETVYVKEQK